MQTDLITIDGKKSMRKALAEGLGLPDYAYIMQTFQNVDISKDPDFQRHFDHFYRIRRNEKWRKEYYRLFEESKNKSVTFEDILYKIKDRTDGRIEASFASKMLATIDSDMPIWDSRVLSALHLRLTGKSETEKMNNAVDIYSEMTSWYQEYLSTKEAQQNIKVFDTYLPEYAWISNVKKIDYMLWESA